MSRKTLVWSAITLLFAAALVAALVFHSQPEEKPAARAEPPPAPERPVVTDSAALVRFHSPSFGDPAAKVHIVEFFDPACGTCREFYPFVKSLMDRNPGRIRLSLRYTPFHKGADQVVRMLEGARRQGKYREALEALLAEQGQWTVHHVARPDLAWQVLERAGLEMARLKADMQTPDIDNVLQQDMRDAVTLNVTKTPEFFVNGRPLARFGYEELQLLVQAALREAYP